MTPRDLLKKARALIFDFDGTLVDSNEIKWRGFERVFRDYPEKINEVMAYCRGFNHVPRWEKFSHVCEKILRIPYGERIEKQLTERFEEATTQAIVDAPEIPGASPFLNSLRGQWQTAILSSTPHDILLEILKLRRWSHYFQQAQGADVNKAEWLRKFRMDRRLTPDELIFFGDTAEDQQAAASAECAFIAVRNKALREKGHYIQDFKIFL